MLFSADASVIEAQESIACVAEDKYGEDAENKIDYDHGNTDGWGVAEWDKYDENTEQGVCDVYYDSVIRLDYEALEI